MLLLPIAAGYVAGPERGAVFGFAVGIAADLFLPTTFGLSALVGCLLGFGVGFATAGLVRSSWWLPPVVAAAATAAGLAAYAILGAVLGDPGIVRTSWRRPSSWPCPRPWSWPAGAARRAWALPAPAIERGEPRRGRRPDGEAPRGAAWRSPCAAPTRRGARRGRREAPRLAAPAAPSPAGRRFNPRPKARKPGRDHRPRGPRMRPPKRWSTG